MKRLLIALTAFAFLSSSAVAFASHQDASVDPQPGLVDASNPLLYAADTAVDNAAVQLGLRDSGNVAFERASEVSVAVEGNNSEAVNRSLRELNDVAEAATGNSTGLAKAESVLTQVRERVPKEAQFGIDNALSNIERAQERIPDGAGPEDIGRP